MNYLVIHFLGIIILSFASGTIVGEIMAQNSQNYSQSTQTINVSSENLNQPYWLTINATPSTQINGQIRLNNQIIHSLNSPSTRLNLTPYLGFGRHQLEIIGRYTPVEHSIDISLTGKNTQINQQTSGNGLIHQTINLEVR